MSSGIPVKSIKALVEYLWADEERHYLESIDDFDMENETLYKQKIRASIHSDHILGDLVRVREWFAANGK